MSGNKQTIRPSRLKPLFGTSLTPTFLLSALETFSTIGVSTSSSAANEQTKVSAAQIRPYVTALPSIERFAIIVMFLSEAEKEQIRAALELVGVDRKAWGV